MNLIFNNTGVIIRKNEDGFYSMNDIHKLSGSDPSKAPAQWLRTKEAQELIYECEIITMQNHTVKKSEGRYGGTYVHELLLVSYAGWISRKFQLYINQVFLNSERERIAQLEKEKAQLIEFKDDIYRKSIVDNYIGSKFPTLSEKVAKDIRVILRIIRNQGKEKFGYISFDNIIFASKTSHHEAWSYLRRTGALIEDGVCRFTKSPLYRLSDKTII